jgi:predicted dehydrogenase
MLHSVESAFHPEEGTRAKGSAGGRVRVAVVGLAGVGMVHLVAIAVLSDAYQLVAVADSDAERAKQAAAGFGVAAFTSLDEVIAAGGVDAVILAVPPYLHGPLTTTALAAGLHVYCEKPLTPTAAEGRALAVAASRAGRVVQVGLQYRFLPAYVEAAALVASGALGRIHRVSVTATTWFRPTRYFTSRPWRAGWATVGGGVLMHQTCHQVDGLISLVGAPCRVTADAWRSLHNTEVEDSVALLLEFPGGIRGTLVASTAEPVGTNRTEVHGSLGSVVIEGFGLRRGVTPGSAASLARAGTDDLAAIPVSWTDVVSDGGPGMELAAIVDCHRDFLASVSSGAPPRNHPLEATRAVETINAAYLSALRRVPITIPAADGDYATAYADLCTGRCVLPFTGGEADSGGEG